MRNLNEDAVQERFAEVLNHVVRDREPVVVTRTGKESIVIIPLAEHESLQESIHLLRSPANARRLLDSIDRLEVELPND